MRRDTMRDLFGRDLVHLALIISLLRLDIPYSRQPLLQTSNNILFDLDPYEETLSRHKEVLADLNSLGRYSQPTPSEGAIGSIHNRWGGGTGQIPAPIEISAYVLNTEAHLPDSIVHDVRPSTSSGIGRSSIPSSATRRTHAANSESDGGFSDSASISDVDSGIENNVGDFGGYASSQSGGNHSPISIASGSECSSDHAETFINESKQNSEPIPPRTPQISLSEEDNNLENPLYSPYSITHNEFGLDLDLDLGPPLPGFEDYLLGQDSEENILPSAHLLDPHSETIDPPSLELNSANLNLFAPDEEDVENQLMHIDDQLIRLDDDIENINEGVQRTLDEAIMVHNLSPTTVQEGLDEAMEVAFQDENSNMGLETLLGADEEAFLFSTLEDESDLFTDALIATADRVAEVNPFDDWQADTNLELDNLLSASVPSSNVRPPPPVAVESVIKTEPAEDVDNDENASTFSNQRKVDSEPEKNPSTIKEEVFSDDEDTFDSSSDTQGNIYGATADVDSPLYFNNNNNIVADSKEVKFGAFNPQIHSSNHRPISSDNSENSHLLDHNYAASAFDECFGDSWKAEKEDCGASSVDYYEFLEDRSGPTSPASSIATSYGGASIFSGSGSSASYRESRDERKVRLNGLPLSCSQIIDSSMEEFNDLLTRHTMTEEQISLCRDIRRRGKNKVAAQNCRKRKLNLISHLQEEVDTYRQTKQSLLAERQELYRMRNEWTNKLLNLEDQVLRGLGKNSDNYSLELMPHSQQIRIAQRHTSTAAATRRRLAKPTRA